MVFLTLSANFVDEWLDFCRKIAAKDTRVLEDVYRPTSCEIVVRTPYLLKSKGPIRLIPQKQLGASGACREICRQMLEHKEVRRESSS